MPSPGPPPTPLQSAVHTAHPSITTKLGLISRLGVLGTTLLKACKGKGRVSSLVVCRKRDATDRTCRVRQVSGAPGWTDPSEVTACAVRSGLSNALAPVFLYTLTEY